MPITAISQTILNEDSIVISATLLKQTNLIFAEHEKLLIENLLLYEQLGNYKTDNDLLIKKDSIRIEQLNNYKSLSESYNAKIKELDKQLKKKDKHGNNLKIYGISISALLIFSILK